MVQHRWDGRGAARERGLTAGDPLRPAFELALEVARAGEESTPPLPAPAAIRPLLNHRRMTATALATIRRVLEDDARFRQRVAVAAEEAVLGRPAWLFLARPDGWQAELAAPAPAPTAGDVAGAVGEAGGSERDRATRAAKKKAEEAERARLQAVADRDEAKSRATAVTEQLRIEREARAAAETEAGELRQRVAAIGKERDSAHRRAATADQLRRRITELEAALEAASAAAPDAAATEAGAGAGVRVADGVGGGPAGTVSAMDSGLGSPAGGAAGDGLEAGVASRAEQRLIAGPDPSATGVGSARVETGATSGGEGAPGSPAPGRATRAVDLDAVASAVAAASDAASSLARSLARAAAALGSEPTRPASEIGPVSLDRSGSDEASAPALPHRTRRSVPKRRPVPLPPAILDDSRQAAEHLVRIPGALLVVDGYNATMTYRPDLALPEQRRRLADALAELSARTGIEVHVVFDGAADAWASEGGGRKRVRVSFTATDVEADDAILDLVDAEPVTRPVVVASSDRRVQAGTTRRGANPISTEQLLAALRREH